jgi:hypothetical protein
MLCDVYWAEEPVVYVSLLLIHPVHVIEDDKIPDKLSLQIPDMMR